LENLQSFYGDEVLEYRDVIDKYIPHEITLLDLQLNLTNLDLISSVEQQDKLKMTLFVNKYLKSLPSMEETPDTMKSSKGVTITNLGKIIFSGLLVSSKFNWKYFPNYISTSRLEGYLSDHYSFVWETIKYLDLSHCSLFNEDLLYISQIVMRMKSCKVVDLSNNKISKGELENFYTLLEMEHIDFVNVVSNPIASIDCKEEFLSFKEIYFQKLIFIPQNWIPQGNWKVLVENEAKQKIVAETHKKFYEEFDLYHLNKHLQEKFKDL